MAYRISTYDPRHIVLHEQNRTDSILQNIWLLLHTWRGSVPLYREYGYNPRLLHKPVNVVESLLAEDVTEQIEKYEPRARVLSVSFGVHKDTPDTLEATVDVEVIGDGSDYTT